MADRIQQILCGGDPEPHFERLGVEARCTFDGMHPRWDERWTVWELGTAAYGRLLADASAGPARSDAWSETGAWWRSCDGSNLGSCDHEDVIHGHRLQTWSGYRWDDDDWDAEEDGPAPEPRCESWPDVLTYLCDAVGVSTERNVAACLTDLASANGLSVGELLDRTLPKREAADD